jgi:hypothetical protein
VIGRDMFTAVESMPVRQRTLAHWMGPRRMSYLACLKHGVQRGPMSAAHAESEGGKHVHCLACCKEIAAAVTEFNEAVKLP